MEQYVYDPPAGSKPLEFHHNGGPIAIQPPDQFWKREEEEYVVGVKLDHQGQVRYEHKRTRTIWVPDVEKNAAAVKSGLKPDNTAWLTKGKFRSAMAGKYQPLNKYLRPVKDIDKAFRKSTAQLEVEHNEQLEKMKAQFEAEKRILQDGALKEIQEMRASFRGTLQDVANELAVDVKLLEEALMKQREQTHGGRQTKGREARREGRVILENQGTEPKT